MVKCFIHGSNRNFNNGEKIVQKKEMRSSAIIQLHK